MTATSDLEFVSKQLYRNGLKKEKLAERSVLLSLIEHNTKFATPGNKTIEIPVPYANGQGLAATYAGAYANRSAPVGDKFAVPQRHMIQYGQFDAEVIRNAEAAGDEEAFLDAVEYTIDGHTATFGTEINQNLYRTNKGVRCYATFSGAVATLTDAAGNAVPEFTAFFDIGMRVGALDTSSSDAVLSGAATVTAVDEIAGTVTASANWTTAITSLANGDKLIRAETAGNTSFDGLDGWVPVTAVSDFLGVNQTLHRTRLAGLYLSIANAPIAVGMLKVIATGERIQGKRYGAETPWIMNPMDAMHFVQQVEAARVVNTSVVGTFNVGVKAIEVMGATIVKDPHCPVGTAFQIPRGAFTLATAGKQPKIETIDGSRFSLNRQTGAVEFTMALDGNCYSTEVDKIVRVALPPYPTFS